MKSITIKGSKRESVGKKATKALRNAEMVPCVVYGGGRNIHFSAEEISFDKLVYTPDVHTVNLELKEEDEPLNAILQDIQFHPVTDNIMHADFYEYTKGQQITMEIPIHAEGVPVGVKNGGILRFNLRRMEVRGVPSELPDFIEVDVSDLTIGDNLYVTEASGDNYEILHDDDALICQVTAMRDLEALEPDDEDEVDADEVPASEVDEEEGDDAEGEGEDKE